MQINQLKLLTSLKLLLSLVNVIENFEQGNHTSNLEIAIAGYESALKVITHQAFPQIWASIQQNLIHAYQQRQEILSTTITELKENTVQNQTQIHDLIEHFQQEKQQTCELKAQLLEVMESQKEPALTIDLQPIVSAIQATKSALPNFNTVVFYDIENLTLGSSNPQISLFIKRDYRKHQAI